MIFILISYLSFFALYVFQLCIIGIGAGLIAIIAYNIFKTYKNYQDMMITFEHREKTFDVVSCISFCQDMISNKMEVVNKDESITNSKRTRELNKLEKHFNILKLMRNMIDNQYLVMIFLKEEEKEVVNDK